MNRKLFYSLGVAVLLFSMILAACAPKATETPTQPPATEAPTQAAPAVTEAPTAVPATTEAPTQPPAKKTIIIGTTDRLASLDPADAYAVRDWELIRNILV